MRIDPWAVHSSRSPSRKPGRGATTPMFPTTGSTITAATAPGCSRKRRSTLSRSLKTAVTVSRAVASVTPGLSGDPKVAAPEPARMRNESPWPW